MRRRLASEARTCEIRPTQMPNGGNQRPVTVMKQFFEKLKIRCNKTRIDEPEALATALRACDFQRWRSFKLDARHCIDCVVVVDSGCGCVAAGVPPMVEIA